MEHLQTRDATGEQVRAAIRHADVVRELRAGDLPPVLRGVMLEYVEAAVTADSRAPLAGARFLARAASEMPNLPRLRETTRRLATAFVHPPIR